MRDLHSMDTTELESYLAQLEAKWQFAFNEDGASGPTCEKIADEINAVRAVIGGRVWNTK